MNHQNRILLEQNFVDLTEAHGSTVGYIGKHGANYCSSSLSISNPRR
jgi:hypothetical protein